MGRFILIKGGIVHIFTSFKSLVVISVRYRLFEQKCLMLLLKNTTTLLRNHNDCFYRLSSPRTRGVFYLLSPKLRHSSGPFKQEVV